MSRHLAEADARRDAGDWRGAAAAYARHLDANPADWPIWVQHGHCVKEAGDPRAALDSYRRAEAGMPRDADVALQIGHALKLLGDLDGARAAYGRAVARDPLNDDAWREADALLAAPDAPASTESQRAKLAAWSGSARSGITTGPQSCTSGA
ncbi:tetratricopeptide repeat protein [Leptolyngbya sp. 15MV]|nr:tetratricopeptide repeat protein [Leptolyngbya sp. 15MV]